MKSYLYLVKKSRCLYVCTYAHMCMWIYIYVYICPYGIDDASASYRVFTLESLYCFFIDPIYSVS